VSTKNFVSNDPQVMSGEYEIMISHGLPMMIDMWLHYYLLGKSFQALSWFFCKVCV